MLKYRWLSGNQADKTGKIGDFEGLNEVLK